MANIIGIDPESVSDGPGVRFTIFFAGCRHNCPGCHNPEAQDFTAGMEFDDRMQEALIRYIAHCPIISGVTLSGGDPMFSAGDVLRFVLRVREKLPGINIWLYSGFTYEEIIAETERRQLLDQCDVLVDGRFEQENLDLSSSFRGSTNQRIIDLAATRAAGEIHLIERRLTAEEEGL